MVSGAKRRRPKPMLFSFRWYSCHERERVNRCFAPSIVIWPLRVEIDAKSTGPHGCINGGTQTTSIWRSEGDVARED